MLEFDIKDHIRTTTTANIKNRQEFDISSENFKKIVFILQYFVFISPNVFSRRTFK